MKNICFFVGTVTVPPGSMAFCFPRSAKLSSVCILTSSTLLFTHSIRPSRALITGATRANIQTQT